VFSSFKRRCNVLAPKPSFISTVFEPCSKSELNDLPKFIQAQIQACYGNLSEVFIQQVKASLFNTISYSKHLWAELIWAVKYEQIQHLDDLLLRRTRLGNVLPDGAAKHLDDIKDICLQELGWSEDKWQIEACRYKALWLQCYSLPEACKL